MKYFIIIFALLSLCSCSNIRQKKDALSVVEQWIGKEIVYPENLIFTILGVDTLSSEAQSQYSYKVVSYVDSTGCTSCKLQLPRWKAFIAEMDSISKEKNVMCFILHSKEASDIVYTLKYNNFKFPVCIDKNDSFYKLNHLPSNIAFQTFLLDKNNKVMAIGNPINNLKVKDLYLNIIRGEKVESKSDKKVFNTEIDINKTSAFLASFDWQKEQKVTFTLKNIGDIPLVIEDVNTSCGCTTIEFEKEPIQPRGRLDLHVTYKAEHPGHFNKTITVHCNVESSPIKLTISGNAQ